jgi:hypothetical protein
VFYTDDHTKDFCPCCERTMEPRTGSRTKVEQRRDTTRQVVTPVARVSRPPIDEEAAAQQRAIDDAESRF